MRRANNFVPPINGVVHDTMRGTMSIWFKPKICLHNHTVASSALTINIEIVIIENQLMNKGSTYRVHTLIMHEREKVDFVKGAAIKAAY